MSIVSPEELPEWLNEDFFKNHLSIPGDLSIRDIQFACQKGENFASKIYRVVLEFAGKQHSVIVKSRPTEGFSEEFSKKFSIFPKEIEMYGIIDRLEQLYSSIGNENVCFAPK
jgi:hypothetical protein